ncbi:hypothetical protein [Nocardia aurantiaca]|uniref:Uncharacterized protein n=1 Tax=Nocardia aurantiaca TaxID=2675850 RepID=A0A6I3KNQ3_9NOCA|nr:hypothetical protein [Nocardia aurantiaca]MTE11632.1 hypothetical protein [Nocardia aurantiaca]
MSFDPNGKTVDQILDYGAPGLQYWEHFLPLYTEAFGAPRGVVLADLYARYDEQRGTKLADFDTARTELGKALDEAEARWSSHRSVAQTLPTAWTGVTGTEALTIVNSQLRQARDDLDTIRAASTAMAAALDPLRRSVLAKAEHTLALLESTADGAGRVVIDGRTPDDIEALGATDPWLTGTFRADVDHKLAAFTATCDATDETFESHYRTIITALAQVIDHPYPQPAQALLPQPDVNPMPSPPTPQPLPAPQSYPAVSQAPTVQPQPSQQPVVAPAHSPTPTESPGASEPLRAQPQGRSQPAGGAPEAVPDHAVSTEPAAATEQAASPAATDMAQSPSDQLGRTVKAALDQLETSLQQGISATIEKFGALTGQTSPTIEDPDGPLDSRRRPDRSADSVLTSGRLEFDFAGKHLLLERTSEGDVTVAVTDESGRTHTYALSFDQNGDPVLTTDDPAHGPVAPAGDGAPQQSPPSSTDTPPTADGGGTNGTSEDTRPMEPGEASGPAPGAPVQPDCAPLTCAVPDASAAPTPDACPDRVPDLAAPPDVPASPPTLEHRALPNCAQSSPPEQVVGACPPPTPTAPDQYLGAPAQPLENPASPLTDPPPSLAEPGARMEIPEGGVEIPETTDLVVP